MKKSILTLTIIITLLISHFSPLTSVYAATTPTPDQKLNKQIDQLKDKIASRVSELNLVEKRGVIGIVVSSKSNQITLTDIAGNEQLVDVDEITKFSSATNKASFGISDMTKGTRISVLGLYNKESKRILARFIATESDPTRVSGTITALDTKNNTITVQTNDGKQSTIDVGIATKITSTSNGSPLTRYGFSKMTVGDRILSIGSPDKKDPTLIQADRIIDFLGAPKNPNISTTTPTAVPSAAPTSAGAKGIKPIK